MSDKLIQGYELLILLEAVEDCLGATFVFKHPDLGALHNWEVTYKKKKYCGDGLNVSEFRKAVSWLHKVNREY